MKSLRELYRIGQGPSSSHTMGPRRAAEQYKQRHPEAKRFRVTLYGSLAATGKGHLTDWAILQVLGNENTEIVWKADTVLPFHPNGMRFEVKMADGSLADPWTVFSVGGGALAVEGETQPESPDIYPLNHLGEIKHWCEEHGMAYWEYVQHCEGEGIWDYLEEVWRTMCAAVERGIEHEGVLPGELKLRRKAPDYYIRANMTYESPLMLLSWLPGVGRLVESERIYCSALAVRHLHPYMEYGYGFTNRLFSMGVFAAMRNTHFDGFGFKMGFELFSKW